MLFRSRRRHWTSSSLWRLAISLAASLGISREWLTSAGPPTSGPSAHHRRPAREVEARAPSPRHTSALTAVPPLYQAHPPRFISPAPTTPPPSRPHRRLRPRKQLFASASGRCSAPNRTVRTRRTKDFAVFESQRSTRHVWETPTSRWRTASRCSRRRRPLRRSPTQPARGW